MKTTSIAKTIAAATIVATCILGSGCKTLTATVDALDGIVGDPVVHEGTVKSVTASDTETTIYFEDGAGYTCKGRQSASPGMNVKIRDGENGMYAE